MRYFICTAIILLLSCSREDDFFEGEILYTITVSPEDAKIDTTLVQDHYGKESHFYFKRGNYRWNMQSKLWTGMIYIQKENKLYYQLRESEVTGWKRGEDLTDSVISIKASPSEIFILGHRCDVMEIKTKLLINNIQRVRNYYYSSDLKVNPEWIEKNRNGNFDVIYNTMKALPLKIVDDFGYFTITYEATQITPRQLEDSLFIIDSGAHLLEFPNSLIKK